MTCRLLSIVAIAFMGFALGCTRSAGVAKKALDAASMDLSGPKPSDSAATMGDAKGADLPPDLRIGPGAALAFDSGVDPSAADMASASEAGAHPDTNRDAASAPTDAVACPNTLSPGNSTKTLTSGGVTRNYLVHVPAAYDGSKPVPLVINMHGLTESAKLQAEKSGWRAKSDQVGFIVVEPNGLNASWNGGSLCCGISQLTGVDDEGFIKAIVAKMRAEACIDAKRVYATGFSNGGAMSHLLACRAADVFAAAAPVSMGNGTSPCKPVRPLSVVLFRGTSDLLVGYGGGLFPSAKADFDQWKTLDGCTGQPAATHGLCQTYSGCDAGVEVTLCTVDAGHDLYAAAAAAGAAVADVAWEAFARATLP